MKTRITCSVGFLVTLFCLGTTFIARADDLTQYEKHKKIGRALNHNGDRRAAIKEFEIAYRASPNPDMLFNIGLLYKKLAGDAGVQNPSEDAQRSIDNFQLYVERYRTEHGGDPSDVKTVERYIRELRQSLASNALGRTPLPTDPVTPSSATPETPTSSAAAQKPSLAMVQPPLVPLGQPDASHVAPQPGQASQASVEVARPLDPGVRAPGRPRGRIVAGAVLVSIGLAAAGTGAALLGIGSSNGSGGKSYSLGDFKSNANTFDLLGGGAVGVGAAALIAGIVILAIPPRRDAGGAALRIMPSAGGITIAGGF